MTPEEHYAKGQEYLEEADGEFEYGCWTDAAVTAQMANSHFLAAQAGHALRSAPATAVVRAARR